MLLLHIACSEEDAAAHSQFTFGQSSHAACLYVFEIHREKTTRKLPHIHPEKKRQLTADCRDMNQTGHTGRAEEYVIALDELMRSDPEEGSKQKDP